MTPRTSNETRCHTPIAKALDWMTYIDSELDHYHKIRYQIVQPRILRIFSRAASVQTLDATVSDISFILVTVSST